MRVGPQISFTFEFLQRRLDGVAVKNAKRPLYLMDRDEIITLFDSRG